MLSVNRRAYELVQKLCERPDEYNVIVKVTKSGVTLVDAGINAAGGFNAGTIVTEVCMGGLGKAQISTRPYENIGLPAIFIQTDHPALATLGSQFAGWQIKSGDFFAIGSGPARALALKPLDIYDKIKYKDEAEVAVLVLETAREPPTGLIEQFSSECKVSPSQLFIILVPTTCVAGSAQVSGRIVETGLHKLSKLGIDPMTIQCAWGYAPIAPAHPKFAEAMGRTNDVILYGGVTYYALRHGDDEKLEAVLDKAPSSASKQYGKPFKEIFKEANCDFYQIDPNLFAPAVFVVNNISSGRVFRAGRVNVDVLERSLSASTKPS